MEHLSSRADRLADVMINLVAESGLAGLSVRALASRAGVSIGAVQHHFPTKEQMLSEAFSRVVARVTARVESGGASTAASGSEARLVELLCQLLPLDADRAAEARVMMEFAVAAIGRPELADLQTATLERVVDDVAKAFAAIRSADQARVIDRRNARLAVAAVDGLTLHALSAPNLLSQKDLTSAARNLVSALATPRHASDRRGDLRSGR